MNTNSTSCSHFFQLAFASSLNDGIYRIEQVLALIRLTSGSISTRSSQHRDCHVWTSVKQSLGDGVIPNASIPGPLTRKAGTRCASQCVVRGTCIEVPCDDARLVHNYGASDLMSPVRWLAVEIMNLHAEGLSERKSLVRKLVPERHTELSVLLHETICNLIPLSYESFVRFESRLDSMTATT